MSLHRAFFPFVGGPAVLHRMCGASGLCRVLPRRALDPIRREPILLLPAVCSAGFDTWWVPDTVGGRWGNSAFQLQDIAWPDTACMDGNGCVRGSADFWWVFTAAALIWSPCKLLPCIWGGTVATVQLSSECRQPLAWSQSALAHSLTSWLACLKEC